MRLSEGTHEIGAIGVDSGQMMLIDPCYIAQFLSDEFGEDSAEPLSYSNACRITMDAGAGLLSYGHLSDTGMAAVCSTGLGDGIYPVYVTVNAAGRITSMRILFMDEDE